MACRGLIDASDEKKIGFGLFVQPEIVAFGWGKRYLNNLFRYASERRVRVASWEDLGTADPEEGSAVAIFGRDRRWIERALDRAEECGCRPIILIGHVGTSARRGVFSVSTDEREVTEDCLEHLRGSGRRRIAFFGAREGDIADEIKAETARESCGEDNVFVAGEDGIDRCFDRFFERCGDFDAVLAANDVIAVYLLTRLRAAGIDVPRQIAVMGQGNLWIGAHVTPSLSTVRSDVETMIRAAMGCASRLSAFAAIRRVDIRVASVIVERESTGGVSHEDAFDSEYRGYEFARAGESDMASSMIGRIMRIDAAVAAATEIDRTILARLAEGRTYQQIADEVFVSEDTVKYHAKKLYRDLGVHSRSELTDLLREFSVRI